MPAFSALRAVVTKKSKFVLASAGPLGCFQAFMCPPGPCNMIPNVIFFWAIGSILWRRSGDEGKPLFCKQLDGVQALGGGQSRRIENEFLDAVAAMKRIQLL